MRFLFEDGPWSSMSVLNELLLRMFGHPRGALGRLGGRIMARSNAECGFWVSDLLQIAPNDRVLEVGFGPGVVTERLTKLAPAGRVAGFDHSIEMVELARARNITTIQKGGVDLQWGSVESLPFGDSIFDKALAINSMHVWPDAIVGLREIRRVMKSGGRIALGFTPYSGQSKDGLTNTLVSAGFVKARLVEKETTGFCALAIKP
jgi:ubiquinone/menaquinone biosynthesis C-methylase UbiE